MTTRRAMAVWILALCVWASPAFGQSQAINGTIEGTVKDGEAGVLPGVSPFDPLTFTVVPAALTVVVLVATFLPARRAARLDAVAALRNE